MSWLSSVSNSIGDTVSSWVPSEVKNAIPNEIKPIIDPVGVGGLNKDPSIINTLDPLNLSGKRTDSSSGPTAVSSSTAAPSYDDTLLKAFNAQLAIEPQLLAANQLYQPQWLALQNQSQASTAQNQMDLMAKLYPQSGTIEAAYQNQLRNNQIQQLQTALPQYQEAFNALTPGYAQALTNAGQLAQSSMERAKAVPQLTAFEGQIGNPYAVPMGGQSPRPQAYSSSNFIPSLPQVGPMPQVEQSSSSQMQSPSTATSTSSQFNPSQQAALPFQAQSNIGSSAQTEAQQQALQARQAYSTYLSQQGPPPPLQQGTPVGNYVGNVAQYNPANINQAAGLPVSAGNANAVTNPQQTADLAGAVPEAKNISGIAGPKLASGLENVNQASVDQYLKAMPGMQNYASMLAQISQQELSAGRGLTPEEQRMAEQASRSGYAARGTALGGQAVAAEVLNNADVANQRYQQRLNTAQQAATGIQNIYQPALAQSLQRQQAGLQYDITAQGQGFNQAQIKDATAANLQQQRYAQLMGAQSSAFEQANVKDTAASQLQQQKYAQLMGQEQLAQSSQAQNYQQAMGKEQLSAGAQQTAFNQALQRGQAEQQRLTASNTIQAGQAQIGAGAMGQLQQAQTPILQAYYQQPILPQTVNQAQTMGLANQQASGNTLFQPESSLAFQAAFLPYQSSIATQQAQLTANATKSAGQNAMIGSIAGGVGTAAAAALCWVAREVYGTENNRWKIFRAWMLNDAPIWFKNAYIKHGLKIADFIKDKPVLKIVIRKWMDSKIELYLLA